VNEKNSLKVEIRKGISFLESLAPEPGQDGLDFWLSAAAKPWIEGTLKATGFTVSMERGDASSFLVIYLRRLFPGLTLASGYPYSTILGDLELFWEKFESIRHTLQRLGVARLELALSQKEMRRCITPEARHWISSRYWVSLQASRQIMSLTAYPSLSELESHYPAQLRWAIRKANKSGAKITSAGEDAIEAVQRLYETTMREKGAPAYYDAERFRTIARELAPRGQGAIFLGTLDGKPAGMAAVIDSSATRHLIQVAVPRAYRNYRLSDLLVASAIQDAYQKGQRYFDFMSTAKNDAGLAQFKEKWGAESESIFHAVIGLKPFHSLLIDRLRLASRLLAGLRRVRD
jgi:hypothetical protein